MQPGQRKQIVKVDWELRKWLKMARETSVIYQNFWQTCPTTRGRSPHLVWLHKTLIEEMDAVVTRLDQITEEITADEAFYNNESELERKSQ